GLPASDVFYFGNAIGESGNSSSDAIVDVTDEIGARNESHTFLNPADVSNVHDYNRDGRVDATDQLIARNNATDPSTALVLWTPPVNAFVANPQRVSARVDDAWEALKHRLVARSRQHKAGR